MNQDEKAFYRQMAASPGDEAVHKVFADWLDGQSRHDEAKYHRNWTVEADRGRKMAMKGDIIELYVFEENNYYRACDRMPVFEDGQLTRDSNCELSSEFSDAEDLKMFGISRELKTNEVVKVRLIVDSMETGSFEVRADFKPFVPETKPKAKAKRKSATANPLD